MPKTTTIKINSKCDVENHRSMSLTDSHGLPSQAKWQNKDPNFEYAITLPDGIWESVDTACSNSLSFTVQKKGVKGDTSCVYKVVSGLGVSHYKVQCSDGTLCVFTLNPQDPDVIINS